MSSSRTLAEPNAARFSNTQDDVFGWIATRYDLLCDLVSLWILLAIARRRLALCAHEVELRQLDAHSMAAVPAASIDLCAISLGLKICNRTLVLAEVLRVLRPGGRIVVLEASNIPVRWLHGAYLSYMSACMPLVGWLATGGDASAYRYLLEGIREFPTAELLAEEMREAGFVDVSFERLSLGIVAIHLARKR
ncbi:MAG TPA: class I SAM-dependent methyltransferase [Steroidobacteraceae bacterium]|nr:class I SAM-dependent methyltransferase [Steroidobacteraceae bacterium]